MSILKWTNKSLKKLKKEREEKEGIQVGEHVIAALLHQQGYSLQANRKTLNQNKQDAHKRDTQFRYIKRLSEGFIRSGHPVISVDTKKKELVGNFKNNGKEYRPKGEPRQVNAHDFGKKKAIGSNGCRVGQFKWELQQLANETGLTIFVCHFPPGTSKWNKIEHRLFSYISKNWQDQPLVSYEVILGLIGSITTQQGLQVQAVLDTGTYLLRKKPTEQQMQHPHLRKHSCHPEWNYTITPHREVISA